MDALEGVDIEGESCGNLSAFFGSASALYRDPCAGIFFFSTVFNVEGSGVLVMTMIALDEHLPIVGRQVKDGIRSLCTSAYTTKPAAKRRSSKEEKQEEEEERQGSTCCAIAF